MIDDAKQKININDLTSIQIEIEKSDEGKWKE